MKKEDVKIGETYLVVETDPFCFAEIGDLVTVTKKLSGERLIVSNNNNPTNTVIKPGQIEPVTRNMDDLKCGDIIISKSFNEYKVLAAIGKMVFLSYTDDFNSFEGGYTIEELKVHGYKLMKPEPEVTKMTIKEAEEALSQAMGKKVKVV